MLIIVLFHIVVYRLSKASISLTLLMLQTKITMQLHGNICDMKGWNGDFVRSTWRREKEARWLEHEFKVLQVRDVVMGQGMQNKIMPTEFGFSII